MYNIEEINFHQSPYELKKNIGTIEIKSRVRGVDEMNSIFKDDKILSVVVHGIKDFEEMSNWIYNHIEKNKTEINKNNDETANIIKEINKKFNKNIVKKASE